jgi:NitT/TauT family transport system substrate-binding protein
VETKLRKHRRIFYLLLLGLICISLAACNQPAADSQGEPVSTQPTEGLEKARIRIGSLLGPTGMGMVKLMEANEQGTSAAEYEFALMAGPDDLIAKIINKEIDVAALPTNMALLLYNRTEGQIQLAAVNTLGTLYLLDQTGAINSVVDLRGKELGISGKGATPDFVMQYLLKHHGLEVDVDVKINYFIQHSDLAAALAAGDMKIGLLPQPHVTTALIRNQNLRIALDINEEWQKTTTGNFELPMGCIVVQKEFVAGNKEAFGQFLAEYRESVAFVNEESHLEEAAQLMEKHGILPNAAIAKAAIPYCNIVFLEAQDARASLDEYYQILYDFEPSSIGGQLADEDFYYNKE